jgi:hypothetical protein
MSEVKDDPREVLALLNSLGFIGITASQLKAFMKGNRVVLSLLTFCLHSMIDFYYYCCCYYYFIEIDKSNSQMFCYENDYGIVPS